MSTLDSQLDARLRAVTPPSGLLERLRALPYADDDGLDEAVRDVALPEGFGQRLAAIPLADDDGLDEVLREVPVPRRLERSVRRQVYHLAKRRAERPIDRALRISRLAMSLSLVLAVTLSLGSAVVLSWFMNRPGDARPGSQIAGQPKQSLPPPEPPLETSWRMLADDTAVTDENDIPTRSVSEDRSMPPDIDLAPLESAADRSRREAVALAMLPVGADPLALAASEVGVHDDWDSLPELPIRPIGLVSRGLEWPLAAQANRPFLIRHGFHPFVSPVAGSALQSCSVPLTIDPSSYELTRRYLERNEIAPPAQVRTEDFLSSMDYGYPAPSARGLGLTAAAGQSPISGDEFSLLQIGVQAWQGDAARHAPLHLVLLVDTSTSMRWGSRIEIVSRALEGLPEVLGPQDRVSLVTFNQAAHVLVEDLGRESLSQFRAAVHALAAEGSTNFAAALREAQGVARESLRANRPPARVVLLTDGLLDLDPAAAEKLERQIAEGAQQGIGLETIDLGQQQKDADPQLAALAKAAQGSVHRATSAEQIRYALREIVSGRSQLVARLARLHVTFSPKAVLEYRLVGHESGEWAGLLPGSLEADFREGQAATGLFELRLTPNGPEEVAKVELSWYTPGDDATLTGKTLQKAVMTVSRRQFAASANSPPWFQQAAVAAYTAEVLRHSPFIFQRHPGMNMPAAWHRAHVLSLAVDGRVAQLPSYQELVDLIAREAKARPARKER